MTSDPRRHHRLGRAGCVVLAIVLSGCGESVAPSESVPPSPAATFALWYEPANGGCLMAAAHNVTFRIDPYAGQAVVAIQDNGRALPVRWSPGFVAGTSDNPVVMDRTGLVVLRDGDRVLKDSAKLHGYELCFGGGYVVVWAPTVP